MREQCFAGITITTFATVIAAFASAVSAADIVVKISGIEESRGEIGCALFKGPDGFPMDNSVARQQWQPAQKGEVECRFRDVPDGSYAASASHDLNGNRRVDTNFLGMPQEAWGVSNNVRPTLRAPRFEEAVFQVREGRDQQLDIRVAK